MSEPELTKTIRAKKGEFAEKVRVEERLNKIKKQRDQVAEVRLICEVCGKEKIWYPEMGSDPGVAFDKHDCTP